MRAELVTVDVSCYVGTLNCGDDTPLAFLAIEYGADAPCIDPLYRSTERVLLDAKRTDDGLCVVHVQTDVFPGLCGNEEVPEYSSSFLIGRDEYDFFNSARERLGGAWGLLLLCSHVLCAFVDENGEVFAKEWKSRSDFDFK